MCGIVGILSVETNWQIKSILYEAVLELLNRGYDSMGVSIIVEDNNQFSVKKALETCEILQFLKEEKKETRNGIAHTRWATHGGVSVVNAHPHVDTVAGRFALVHNGIIENFETHKALLVREGVTFASLTDSEVIVNLIAYHFDRTCRLVENTRDRLVQSLQTTLRTLEGTFGIIVQSTLMPETLFCARRGSPLLIGVSKDRTQGMIVSEKSGFLYHVEKYVSIDDNNIYCLERDGEHVQYSCVGEDCNVTHYSLDSVVVDSAEARSRDTIGFTCHTEREIWDQPASIRRCLNYGSRFTLSGKIKLGGLDPLATTLRGCRHLYLFGCGTSHHVALLGALFFRRIITEAEVVLAFDASEFEMSDLPRTLPETRCCCLFISQSGETLDLARVVEMMKGTRYMRLGIVNVVDSLIARNVEAGVYMNCGRERGVASTKSFTTSVIITWLIAHWFSHTTFENVSLYSGFADTVQDFLVEVTPQLQGLAVSLFDAKPSVLVLGKGLDYFIAKEASLKIKELCYLHAEAYPCGSLKHGPFALLDEDTIVIIVVTDPLAFQKSRNALHEVTARKPKTLLVCTPAFMDTDGTETTHTVVVPNHPWAFLLANMALQYLALQVSLSRGINPDFPRNLAKVVTVE